MPKSDRFDELPVVLSLPDDPRGYVRTAQAQWCDLQTSLEIRQRVARNMMAELAVFEGLLELLAPYMEYTHLTVAQAVAAARKKVS